MSDEKIPEFCEEYLGHIDLFPAGLPRIWVYGVEDFYYLLQILSLHLREDALEKLERIWFRYARVESADDRAIVWNGLQKKYVVVGDYYLLFPCEINLRGLSFFLETKYQLVGALYLADMWECKKEFLILHSLLRKNQRQMRIPHVYYSLLI